MKVTTEREDSILNAVVEGRIDSATVSEFQHTVESAIADDDKAVLIGLQDLAYINSSGLRAILLIAKKLWKRDAKFVLYAPGSVVEEVLTIAGFDKIIQICASKDDALATARN